MTFCASYVRDKLFGDPVEHPTCVFPLSRHRSPKLFKCIRPRRSFQHVVVLTME